MTGTRAPIEMVHVDLSREVTGVPAAAGGGGCCVVFWWGSIPLGQVELLAEQLPLPGPRLVALALEAIVPAVGDALFTRGFKGRLPDVPPEPEALEPPEYAALAALERPLAGMAARAGADEMAVDPPAFSIVVCTRERPDDLCECLASLAALDPPAGETIVVDNAPATERTRAAVERFGGVCYACEPQAGLSAARNRGVRESRGAVVAFTDDDVRVHPGWIAGLARGFFSPEVMAVTGLVLPAELRTEAQVLFQRSFGGFDRGFRRLVYTPHYFAQRKARGVPVWKIGAGASMALRREAFEIAGLFDERLGAGAAGCSEDSELWYRLLAAGRLCCYEPRAVVFHRHRCDLAGLRRQMRLYMRGHAAALLAQGERHGHAGNLYRLFLSLPRYYAGLALRRVVGRRRGSGDAMLFSQVLGWVAGIFYYLRARARGKRADRTTLPRREAAGAAAGGS